VTEGEITVEERFRMLAMIFVVVLAANWAADRIPEKGVLAEVSPSGLAADLPDRVATAFHLSDATTPYESGPFSYRFEHGETLVYRMNAVADGLGFDTGDSDSVGLSLNSDLILYTTGIDGRGNAEMLASFDNLDMTGTYMGETVELYKRDGATSWSMGEHTAVNTAVGDSIDGIPQLEFYNQPIAMTVAPNGHVLKVDGPKGFDQLMSPSDMIEMASFPSANLLVGDEWVSEFNLPIPGLDTPPKAAAQNTLMGYEYVGEHYCGVIRQVLTSDQIDGSITSPSSVLGDAMGFSMPVFSVTGINTIYFDVNSGHLIYTDIDMNLELEIGAELKPAAAMFGAIGSLLEEVEGGAKAPRELVDPDDPLHELGIHIRGTLALVH